MSLRSDQGRSVNSRRWLVAYFDQSAFSRGSGRESCSLIINVSLFIAFKIHSSKTIMTVTGPCQSPPYGTYHTKHRPFQEPDNDHPSEHSRPYVPRLRHNSCPALPSTLDIQFGLTRLRHIIINHASARYSLAPMEPILHRSSGCLCQCATCYSIRLRQFEELLQ